MDKQKKATELQTKVALKSSDNNERKGKSRMKCERYVQGFIRVVCFCVV